MDRKVVEHWGFRIEHEIKFYAGTIPEDVVVVTHEADVFEFVLVHLAELGLLRVDVQLRWPLTRSESAKVTHHDSEEQAVRTALAEMERTGEHTVTNAPEAYDGFWTVTLEWAWGTVNGLPLRVVLTPREHVEWQRERYHSGSYLSATSQRWEEIKASLITQPRVQ